MLISSKESLFIIGKEKNIENSLRDFGVRKYDEAIERLRVKKYKFVAKLYDFQFPFVQEAD